MHARPGHFWSRTSHMLQYAPSRSTSVKDCALFSLQALICPRWLPLWPKGEALAVRNTRNQC